MTRSWFIFLAYLNLIWACAPVRPQHDFSESIDKGHELIFKNLDQAIINADSLLSEAKISGNSIKQGRAYDLLGRAQTFAGFLEEAKDNYDMALSLFEDAHDSLTVKTIRNIAVLHFHDGQLDSAIALSHKVLEYYISQGNDLEAAKTCTNLGSFYQSIGRLAAGIEYSQKAIAFFQKTPDPDMHISRLYVNLGVGLTELDRYEQAKDYYLKSIDTWYDSINVANNTITVHNLGAAYSVLGDGDSARYYLDIAFQMAKEAAMVSIVARSYDEYGLLAMREENNEGAYSYFKMAIQEANKVDGSNLQHLYRIHMARSCMKLGHYPEAKALLDEPIADSYAIDAILRELLLEAKAELNDMTGNSYEAYAYLNEYLALSDSIKGARLQGQLDELKLKYDTQEKEKLITAQRLEFMTQEAGYQSRVNWLLGSFSSLLVLLGSMAIYQRYQGHKKSRLLVSSQIDMIKNQLSPHFLYNSLNILSNLISRDKEKAAYATDQLRHLYQKMVESFGHDVITIREELSVLKAYFDLMVQRFGHSISLKTDIESSSEHLIVPFTLQMLVENAIKHNTMAEPLVITLSEDVTHFIIENPVKPNQTSPYASTKRGLKLLISKYRLLNQKSLEIEHTVDKFTVKIPKIRPTNDSSHH
ncbi:MAG: tetratricopeptide repeat protein [Cyclobacteriaceae bacterium]